ncbi:MAG TPA: DCC1-like thiol-disulfide oxidoreductase family protein [Luteolibacter sp.]|nr:DCC1-like thiol-disulfide oxidoreductase family protein [Luteolibacter sp.]
MDLPRTVEYIEVFYDGRCGMCCLFAEWLGREPHVFRVKLIAYQSPEAERVFPGLGALDPAREMVVRTSEGDIHRGAEAWVWCLSSCARHQDFARRLASPLMLPVAKRACRLLAAKRMTLSKALFRKKDREVRAELHRMDEGGCRDGVCSLE